MTREDAIEYIKLWCPYDKQNEIIEALSAEPQTDRERVIALRVNNRTCNQCKHYECFDRKEFPCIDCMAGCKDRFEAKSIEPQTANWEVYETLHGMWEGTQKFRCSACKEKVGVFKSNYCPNCGAKMKGDKE